MNCAVHSECVAAVRCGECQQGMCRECFDAAPAPWKLCEPCMRRRVAASLPSATTACWSCGKAVPASHSYCGFCGQPLSAAPAAFQASQPYSLATRSVASFAPASPSIAPASTPRAVRDQPLKSPGTAAVLSCFWFGLGQIYNGQLGKGLLLMLLGFPLAIFVVVISFGLLFFVPLLLWIYGVVDAYRTAENINRASW